MIRLAMAFGLIGAFVAGVQAIGLQHGLFRCQSTQGRAWQGTATIVEEKFDITVWPDYLDVEMEWVFETGGTPPDSFKDALEIVGNLNLEDKSTVVGMITWYKGMILKGKLKTNDIAREQYEQVVDRDSDRPPPPRDPVLLEWIRDDNYDISIFPVSFGGTRKVRIRYLVPAFMVDGVNRMAYPHAFTDNARVSVRKGPGVRSYKIVTSSSSNLLENRDFLALNGSQYAFRAYGGGQGTMVNYIVPVIDVDEGKSRFYVGSFATSTFGGQTIHVATMTGEQALRNTPMTEDYVILWRWNHPQILERYGRQIVEQSALLRKFLASLAAADKRVAMIIDKEGGERIVFTLDGNGGTEYNRMIAYLTELSERAVVDPPRRSTPRIGDIDFDVQKAVEEFRDALAAAVELFEKDGNALRHLLILTAGPKLVSSYVADQTVTWDSTIDVSLLGSYYRSNGASEEDLGSFVDQAYWPGVDVNGFVQAHKAGLAVSATIRNDLDTHTIQVLAPSTDNTSWCRIVGTTQAHIFSESTLRREIVWSIRRGDRLLAEYTERPEIVRMIDGMQYGRLIGSSPHLVPLARHMPSSMASTMGFIDEKYSLVALEQDALPADQAALYEERGVPLLENADIFAAADERPEVPVAEWLSVNPPESMGRQVCGGWGIMPSVRAVFFEMDMMAVAGAPAPDGVPVRIGTPQAGTIYASDPEAYVDYESALAAGPVVAPAPVSGRIACFVNDGRIIVDLGGAAERGSVRMVLYDIAGRMVGEWSGGSRGIVTLAAGNSRLRAGTYLLRVFGAGNTLVKRIVVR